MPYARTFVRIRIFGHFGTSAKPGVEQWSTGFQLSSIGGGSFDPTNLLAYLTAIDPAVGVYHALGFVSAGSNCFYDGLTAAYIGTDGLYVLGALQPTTTFTRVTPLAGGGTAPTQPYSSAMCITLRSSRLRGPGSHGRLYWPALSQQPTAATGVINSGNTDGAASAAQTMFNAFNSQAALKFGTGSNVSLVSKVGSGVEAPVISVGIGQRLDHMESRERNIPEANITKTLTTSLLLLEERDRQLREAFEDLDDPAAAPV